MGKLTFPIDKRSTERRHPRLPPVRLTGPDRVRAITPQLGRIEWRPIIGAVDPVVIALKGRPGRVDDEGQQKSRR